MVKDNKFIYNHYYSDKNLALPHKTNRFTHFLVKLRQDYLEKYSFDKAVLDIGCGTGSYLLPVLHKVRWAVGIDISLNMISYLAKKKLSLPSNERKKLFLSVCDARQLPLPSSVFDFVFSYTAIYYVPEVDKAMLEISRVLRNGGVAILEFGNSLSLNMPVSLLHARSKHTAWPFYIRPKQMLDAINRSQFQVLEKRVFQFLPMWGIPGIPWGFIGNVLGIGIGKSILDEKISSLSFIAPFAFRYFFVLRKNA